MTEYTAHRLMVEAKDEEIKAMRETLHRREAVIKILEHELEAIGAGGVDPLRRNADSSQRPVRQPLPQSSPCAMTEAEYRLFKLGWLEAEAAHGITGGQHPEKTTPTEAELMEVIRDAARGTEAQIRKERELCAYAFTGAVADGANGGSGPHCEEDEWLRPAFEAGQEIAKLRAEIEALRKTYQLRDDTKLVLAARQALSVIEMLEVPYGSAEGSSGEIARAALEADRALREALESQPAPSQDAEDAARYRWLRHGDNDEKVMCRGPIASDFWYLLRNEKLDAAIDAARTAGETP